MMSGRTDSTESAVKLSGHDFIDGQEHAARGEEGDLVRIPSDVRISFVKYMFADVTSAFDHGSVSLRMDEMNPAEISMLRSKVGQLTPERSAKKMLDQRFEPLRPFGVSDPGVMLEEVRVVDESKLAHGVILRISLTNERTLSDYNER